MGSYGGFVVSILLSSFGLNSLYTYICQCMCNCPYAEIYKTMKAMQMHSNPNNTVPTSILSPSEVVAFEPEPASALELDIEPEELVEPPVEVVVPLVSEVDTDGAEGEVPEEEVVSKITGDEELKKITAACVSLTNTDNCP